MGIQSILATHDWTFFTPPLSRNAVHAQTLQNGKVPRLSSATASGARVRFWYFTSRGNTQLGDVRGFPRR